MNGRIQSQWLWRFPLLCAAVAAGCEGALPAPPSPAGPSAEASRDYDETANGTVTGRVTWAGDLPKAPPLRGPVSPLSEQERGPVRDWPNPNAPRIDAQGRGVANAVVFLRGVDPRRARPWDHDAAQVELRDYQIHIVQDKTDGPYGFVRRGDAITMASKQDVFHALRGRGAAFFAYTFPAPPSPRRRVLDHAGVVELSSAAGQFWMRAYLFVDDHPYYARTDADGRYRLPLVPAGDYELVCWMPHWREAGHEIDADTRFITCLDFGQPLQLVRPVHINPGDTATADYSLSIDAFGPVRRSGP